MSPREAVQDMKPLEAVEFLLGVIEDMAPESDLSLDWLHLTRAQRRLVSALAVRPGVRTYGHLITAMYGHDPTGDSGCEASLRVHVFKLRRRIANTSLEIINHTGVGYELRDPESLLRPT